MQLLCRGLRQKGRRVRESNFEGIKMINLNHLSLTSPFSFYLVNEAVFTLITIAVIIFATNK